MKLWLPSYGFFWMLLPVLSLPSLPESVENAIENYLGKFLRFRNTLQGLNDPEMYMDVPRFGSRTFDKDSGKARADRGFSDGRCVESFFFFFSRIFKPELVRSRGYPTEVHEVFTDDGYGLTLHRIAGKKQSYKSYPRPVIYFQHGIWQSSACWLLNPVDKALPYVLADQGYDVWLGNLRGTTYSRKHVNYTSTDDKYWDFAWDEMAIYDLPTMLKFVLARTNQKNLTYVGHSLGCAVFFAMADAHPELQSAINFMVALAPASVLPNMRTPIRYLAPHVIELEYMFKSLGTNEFLPNTNLVRFLGQAFCTKGKIKPRKCENFAFILTGSDPASFNHSLVPLISKHAPAGTSVRAVAQFAQGINSKSFRRYDWGPAENRIRYGQDTPPEYSLTNVKVPVAIFYSDNDLLVVPEDVATLARRLGNLRAYHRVPMPEFNHMDFLLALRIDVLLNNDVRKLIETYNPPPTL